MMIRKLRQSYFLLRTNSFIKFLWHIQALLKYFGEHSACYGQVNYCLIFTLFSGNVVDWDIKSEFPESGVIEVSFKFMVLHIGTRVHLKPFKRGFMHFRYTEGLQLAWKSVELKNLSNLENFICICTYMQTYFIYIYIYICTLQYVC